MGLLDGADAVLFDLDDTLLDYSTARDAGIRAWVQQVDAARHTGDAVRVWRELVAGAGRLGPPGAPCVTGFAA